MIVEADAEVRDACAAAAERMGCSVYSTAYIDDFEVVMQQLAPTVIVLDLNMLGRGGADLLNHLVDTGSRALEPDSNSTLAREAQALIDQLQ